MNINAREITPIRKQDMLLRDRLAERNTIGVIVGPKYRDDPHKVGRIYYSEKRQPECCVISTEELRKIRAEMFKARERKLSIPLSPITPSYTTDFMVITKALNELWTNNPTKAYTYDELAKYSKFPLYDDEERQTFKGYLNKLNLKIIIYEGEKYYIKRE